MHCFPSYIDTIRTKTRFFKWSDLIIEFEDNATEALLMSGLPRPTPTHKLLRLGGGIILFIIISILILLPGPSTTAAKVEPPCSKLCSAILPSAHVPLLHFQSFYTSFFSPPPSQFVKRFIIYLRQCLGKSCHTPFPDFCWLLLPPLPLSLSFNLKFVSNRKYIQNIIYFAMAPEEACFS